VTTLFGGAKYCHMFACRQSYRCVWLLLIKYLVNSAIFEATTNVWIGHFVPFLYCSFGTQEVGGTLIGEDGLVVMSGA
jgi:hypothetical protein